MHYILNSLYYLLRTKILDLTYYTFSVAQQPRTLILTTEPQPMVRDKDNDKECLLLNGDSLEFGDCDSTDVLKFTYASM